MDLLRLNKILLTGLMLFFVSCDDIHRKPEGYCDTYVSGGVGFSLFIYGVSDIDFTELSCISNMKGKLNYVNKINERKSLIIGDTLSLKDTLFLDIKGKTFKIHNFINGPMETFTSGEDGRKYENCFLQEMTFNDTILRREWDLTFKIKL